MSIREFLPDANSLQDKVIDFIEDVVIKRQKKVWYHEEWPERCGKCLNSQQR